MIQRDLSIQQRWKLMLGSSFFSWSLQALLLVTSVCVLAALNPVMPLGGADPSWQLALNQAIAEGMVFGRELIFTYGPYASVYLQNYHPATWHLMLMGSLYLSLMYGVLLLLVVRGGRWYLIVAFAVTLAGLMYVRWPTYLSYPLLLGLLCFRLVDVRQNLTIDDGKGAILLLLLFSVLGLLPLTKGSLIVLCGAIAALTFILFAISRRWLWAASIVISTLGSLALFWFMSGQSLADLPRYFASMAPVVSGYSDAMSLVGSRKEVAGYVVVSLMLLCGLLLHGGSSMVHRLFVGSVFFIYLFVAFKSGFVRHMGSAIGSATSLLIAALLYSIVFRTRWSVVVLFSSVLVWIYIDSHARDVSLSSVANRAVSTYSSAWRGIGRWSKGSLDIQFQRRLRKLSEESAFPVFEGTTDIYSNNQSYLIASGNAWNPRPVFQSYVAYLPGLAEKNRQHLLGDGAPDHLFFSTEPIDRRMPSSEDGLSWLPILTRYQPSALENGFLYLHKRDGPSGNPLQKAFITKSSHTLGESVPVPKDYPLVFAQISLKKSVWGHLVAFLFKPQELRLSLVLESGTTTTHRLVSGMAEAGFLLSPLIESTSQFGRLFGDIVRLSDKNVRSFSLSPAGGGADWEADFEVMFSGAMSPPPVDLSGLYNFDRVLESPAAVTVSSAEQCIGGFDAINGTTPAPETLSATDILEVNGWLAVSAIEGVLPDSVRVVLRKRDGGATFFQTRRVQHVWAGKHFKNQNLASSGFTSTLDVSNLSGDYQLGLALVVGDRIEVCQEFDIPVSINAQTY
jgi:hypothetical protein